MADAEGETRDEGGPGSQIVATTIRWRRDVLEALKALAKTNQRTRNGQPPNAAALSERVIEDYLIRKGALKPRKDR